MARRQIGQEVFTFVEDPTPHRCSPDRLLGLIDWSSLDRHLAGIYTAAKGELAWPPLALFRALLLAVWYDLSDVKLAEALEDRASFRRFCGFAAHEPTPERTAFVRFRRELVRRGLDKILFDEVTRQLKAQAVTIKKGTLVDATVISSASTRDEEAAWAGHKHRRAIHGFKAHVAADAVTALVEEVTVTPGNVNDGRAGGEALPENPGDVYADSAYRGTAFASAVQSKGGCPRVVQTGVWSRPGGSALRKLRAWNHHVHHVRCRIEKIFGTWKRSYGLRRMRWTGLAKAALQVRLTAMAYNLKRTAVILMIPQAA
ncbi:IS5 family transposase [Microvirga soli]|uniref:IS5 family transposase n=1 Tax=Microvirga soli TaxID=1854496 RepID=UPI00191CB8A7|nr:IS5 family transposase [Microvirga soli]